MHHGTYVDCTFGRGAHSREILSRLSLDMHQNRGNGNQRAGGYRMQRVVDADGVLPVAHARSQVELAELRHVRE